MAAESDGLLVQSSCAKTNAAKSTSRVSSTSRSSVETPGLKTVVHGSTSATSASPRVRACTSFACFPEEPRKIRGFIPWRLREISCRAATGARRRSVKRRLLTGEEQLGFLSYAGRSG